ncbi:hypothetical protein EI427_04665 [Flammeovirga pectinis]|uniref:Glycosyltransferase n=1 Tax=Flammeovirga pectinis TaxID=2494373 RepID=A0A3S9P026_9BACT|nr:glycosyltransferase [Flammeovirga pectinis]AZQ61545.1 hypothetical protein EI427_04665 [Flammeovirga pectinis]
MLSVNSIGLSKYKLLRVFGDIYESLLFKNLKKFNTILVASSINKITSKEKYYKLKKCSIIQFPTRFDPEIFKVKHIDKISLGFTKEDILLITTGRLSNIKGWRLLIDSYRITYLEKPTLKLVFIGSGEDEYKRIF